MNDVDLSLFQFDYDLTWMVFFLDPQERIYSRYGGRDGRSAEGRVSVAGLKYTMRQVLEIHRRAPKVSVAARKPQLPSDLFAVKGKCLHCHHVWEGLRKRARDIGEAPGELYFVYPLPENIGLQLDVTAGNQVAAVIPDSAAHKAGLRLGDFLETMEKTRVSSQGDVMWALHNAPSEGTLQVQFARAGQSRTVALHLSAGWKRTDLSWRRSIKNLAK
jgi:hypothetical protein